MKKLMYLIAGIIIVIGLNACGNNSLSSNVETITQETTVEMIIETKEQKSSNINVATGSYVLFGNYEQDNNLDNGKEPIEWFVLATNDDGYLLMSRYALDCIQMNDTDRDFTYETSKLRKWLNNDFYNDAFNDDEKESIIEKEIDNPYYDNIKFQVKDGENTLDKVWLINYVEEGNYIPTNFAMTMDGNNRRLSGDFEKATCKPTPYALEKGIYVFNNRCWYHTRYLSFEKDGSIVEIVKGTSARGLRISPTYEHAGVRPVIFINKESKIKAIEFKEDDYKYNVENEYTLIYNNAFITKDSGWGVDMTNLVMGDAAFYPYEVLDTNDGLIEELEAHEEEVVIADQARTQALNEKYKKMYLDAMLSLGLPDGIENTDYKTLKRNCEGGTITFPRYYRLGYNFITDKGSVDDSFNLDRTDFADGLQDNDGNGIDDRDPINALGCIDRNCDGIDDRTWMNMGWYQPKNKYLPNGINTIKDDRQFYPCYKCEHNVVNKCEGNLIIIGSHNNYKNAGSVSIWDNENSRLLCSTCRLRKDSQNKQTHDKNLAIINAGGYAEYAGYSIGSVKNLQGKDYTYKGKDVWEATDGSTLISGLGENDELRWGGTGVAGSSK